MDNFVVGPKLGQLPLRQSSIATISIVQDATRLPMLGYWQTYQEGIPVYFHGQIVSSRKNWLMYSRLTLPLSSDGVLIRR